MATSIKEILNPNMGKKVVNVIENQAPSLLTSLFTNLYSTFRAPVRSTNSTSPVPINKTGKKKLSNVTASPIFDSLRRPGTK
jgi:hypothetical protein